MARTRGAKDSKPRKKPAPKRPTIKRDPVKIERPALPPDDFHAAIAAELHQAPLPQPGQVADPQVGPQGPAPASSFDPAALTLDGLASAWQVPFWALGWALTWLRYLPSPEAVTAVGRRRAKDLAKPSYEIYRHLLSEYLSLNPDNQVHAAGAVTALNGVGIVPDLTEAIVKSRREWIAATQRTQQAPTSGPGQTP